jgi:formate hydrogenlyase subunit 4
MSAAHWFFSPVCALLLAPLLLGIVNRTKSFVAGRRGPPLVQPYRDIAKSLRRGAVYGEVTGWVFRLGPVVNLATLVAALLVLPFGGVGAVVSFPGDLIVLAGLFALGRFVTVLAALDTGSSFEGMGASREVHFAALPSRTGAPSRAGNARAGHRRLVADRHLRRDLARNLGSCPPGARAGRDDSGSPGTR